MSFKQNLRGGRVMVGGTVLEYLRPSLVKLYREAGFDFIYVEFEHGLMDPNRLADFLLCARDNAMPVVSKVPSLDRAWTTKLLDAGVDAIQLPYTESREQIDQLVEWAKYPPIGKRPGCCGLGNTGYADVPVTDLIRRGNDETVLIAHIESEQGVANIEAILDHPQIDVVFIGQYDLSISLGVPGQYSHPKHVAAMDRVFAVGRERGKILGIWAGDFASAKRWIDKGVRFIETHDEMSMIHDSAKTLVAGYHQGK